MDRLQPYQFPFAKYPAVRIALLLAAGIITSYSVSIESYIWIVLLVVTLLSFFITNHLSGNALRINVYYLTLGSYILALFLFGGCRYALVSEDFGPFSHSPLDAFVWEQVQFSGELQQIRQTGTGKYHLDFDIDSTLFGDSLLMVDDYKLRAALAAEDSAQAHQLKLGARVSFLATIYPLKAKRNPHQFDYKNYLASQGIYNQAGMDTIFSITPTNKWLSWNVLRQSAIDIIDQNFDSQTAPLAKALLIGYKNELSRDAKIAFSRVGLSHIMAVSGLHVGFLLAPFWFLIPYLWTYKYGRRTGLFILILLLFYYAGLTGFSASVTRASITGGFIMYARLFNKIRDSINLTAVAAIIILLIDPSEIFEIGFQLSFGAVYIILLAFPVISRTLPNRIRYRWYGGLITIVLVSMCVQAGLFPLLSYYFGEFSLIGPLANAVVVPFLGFMVPYALVLLIPASFFPEAGYYLNIPNQYFLEGLNEFVAVTSAWEASWMQTHVNDPLLFVIWIVAIFLIASLQIPRLRWKLLIVLVALLCIQQGSAIIQKLKPGTLEITVFDVGQGDAALIKTPGNKHILIDTGRWTPGYNSARHVIIPHLKGEGINKLDGVFLSHPHADHIGGIVELINEIPIDTIYNSGYKYNSKLYKNYLALAGQKEIPIVSLSAGTQLTIDPALRLFTYGPEETNASSDPNEHSLILELIYGNTEFLFMGDAGEEQEMRLIKNFPELLDTDFLKVGHHGSRTSSASYFLRAATPDISVVSLAKSNKFKHPHTEAINRLYASESTLHFTSLDGALVFTSDGEKIRQLHWK